MLYLHRLSFMLPLYFDLITVLNWLQHMLCVVISSCLIFRTLLNVTLESIRWSGDIFGNIKIFLIKQWINIRLASTLISHTIGLIPIPTSIIHNWTIWGYPEPDFIILFNHFKMHSDVAIDYARCHCDSCVKFTNLCGIECSVLVYDASWIRKFEIVVVDVE